MSLHQDYVTFVVIYTVPKIAILCIFSVTLHCVTFL